MYSHRFVHNIPTLDQKTCVRSKSHISVQISFLVIKLFTEYWIGLAIFINSEVAVNNYCSKEYFYSN